LILYFISKSIRGFFDNISLNAVSTEIITIIFIIFALYLLVLTNFNKSFSLLKDNIRISIYMKNNVTKDEITALQVKLENFTEINKVLVFSKEDSFNKFKSIFSKEISDFSDFQNPFPVSLAVGLNKLISFAKIEKLITKIKTLDQSKKLISEIDYGSKWLENSLFAFRTLKKAAIIFLAILFSGLFMIVFNTKKLILISRLEELEIMKIMGATNFFITIPILIEAFLLGLIATTASLTILYSFWFYLKAELIKISFLLSGFVFFNIGEILFFVFFGTSLVIFSALFSSLRFLRTIH